MPTASCSPSGSSEGIDFVLTALADPGDEVLVPLPTYPLYTAILHKIGAREVYYRTDPLNGWQPDPAEIRRLITPRTKALVVNDPNNPTGASYAHDDPPRVARTSPTSTTCR